MDPITMAVSALVAAIVVPAWYFSKREKQKRRLRTARRWTLAELPDDTFGKVVGSARVLAETLTAPISGRACVFYLVIVTENEGSDAKAFVREAIGVPFVIEDATGRAEVDPREADVLLVQDRFKILGPLDASTPDEDALLRRHDKRRPGGKTLWYRESIIEPGELIAIFGAGGREPDPDAPPTAEYRGAPAMRLRLSNARTYKLLISDDPVMTA